MNIIVLSDLFVLYFSGRPTSLIQRFFNTARKVVSHSTTMPYLSWSNDLKLHKTLKTRTFPKNSQFLCLLLTKSNCFLSLTSNTIIGLTEHKASTESLKWENCYQLLWSGWHKTEGYADLGNYIVEW